MTAPLDAQTDAQVPAVAPAPLITRQAVENALPKAMKSAVTDDLLKKLNSLQDDEFTQEHIRDNFLGYISVMEQGKFKITDYMNAVIFVSHKLMGKTNKDSYIATFPDRYTDMQARGIDASTIASHFTAYAGNKLVNLIMEQSLVPTWVLNQDLYQKAINRQAYLMMNANSEKVQSDAANSLIQNLKRPEAVKAELKIDVKGNSELEQMRDAISQMAAKQQEMIKQGISSPQEVAGSTLIAKPANPEDAGDIEDAEFEEAPN